MEFREFSDPLSEDYDIKMSHDNGNMSSSYANPYEEELLELLGILEDVTNEDLEREYGISMDEYLHPTKEVVERVKANLGTTKMTK